MKRSHMNFCFECRKPFTITNHIDLCDSCRIVLGIKPGEFQDFETEPEIVRDIRKAYLEFGEKNVVE